MTTKSQTPRLELYNHLIKVRKSVDLLPTAHAAHYQHLHDDHLHTIDGEEVYAVPLEVLAALCNKYRSDMPKLTALLDVVAARGVHHDMLAIRAGETDPRRIFSIGWDAEGLKDTWLAAHPNATEQEQELAKNNGEWGAPAQTFVKTDAGVTIFPLCLHDRATWLGGHHGLVGKAPNPERHEGGKKSEDAIAVTEELLAIIGVKPNHAIIRRTHCRNCGGK